jgi:hypothetical protein
MTKPPTPEVMQGLIETALKTSIKSQEYPEGRTMLGLLDYMDLTVQPKVELEYIRAEDLGDLLFAAQHEGRMPTSDLQRSRSHFHASSLLTQLHASGWVIQRRKP